MLNKKLSTTIRTIVLLAPILTPGLTAHAQTWNYLGGSAAYDIMTGKPNTLTDMSAHLPSDLKATILARLPEGVAIGNNLTASNYIANDAGANVILKKSANIKVSFISEGAGYLNSVGYFKFNASELSSLPITSVVDTIIFPNFSDNLLQFGQAVDLGNFSAGDAIGFTIVANGWLPGGINAFKTANSIFRTIRRFNPENPSTTNLEAHTLLYVYPEKQLLILAFEDLNRKTSSANDGNLTSDDDFNDVILAIHVDPFDAVDCTDCNDITKVIGESGPISWREITTPAVVTDTLEQQKANIKKQGQANKK